MLQPNPTVQDAVGWKWDIMKQIRLDANSGLSGKSPHQDRRLTTDRQYSDRGETVDWIILVPDNYPLTIVKVNYDRLNPRQLEVIWEPEGGMAETNREDKIKRVFELTSGNDELTNLLKELLVEEENS